MLTPNDKFNFGKYRGQLLSDVYKYFPNYIEWAILNVSSFCIDVEDFERLPLPTPLDSRSQLEIVDRAKYELYLEKLKKDLEEKDLCTGGILEAKIQLMGYGKNTKTANTGLLFVVDHIDDRHDYIARLASQGVAPKAVDYKFPHEVINRNEEKRQG